MPDISELSRCEEEAQSRAAVCCGVSPCVHRRVQSAAPEATSPASPFSRAMVHALAGEPIPRRLIAALQDEGGDMEAITRAISRHRRA